MGLGGSSRARVLGMSPVKRTQSDTPSIGTVQGHPEVWTLGGMLREGVKSEAGGDAVTHQHRRRPA
jgi:hypothetical protein